MLYDKDGNHLQAGYNKNGQSLIAAYSANGIQVFPDGPIPLKVMEYNVGGWFDGTGSNVPSAKFEDYYSLQYFTIADNDPDVLVLNEYWELFSDSGYTALALLQQFFPYIYAVPYSARKSMGRAFCSKYPLSGYVNHVYTGYSPRYYDSITMKIRGVDITLVVTHLGLTLEEREPQLAELITYLQSIQTPFILAGDLNTLYCKTTTDEDYVALVVPLLNAGFNLANCSGFGFIETYADGSWTGCLDHIVTSSGIQILSAQRDPRKLSAGFEERVDHMPLVATVEIH